MSIFVLSKGTSGDKVHPTIQMKVLILRKKYIIKIIQRSQFHGYTTNVLLQNYLETQRKQALCTFIVVQLMFDCIHLETSYLFGTY